MSRRPLVDRFRSARDGGPDGDLAVLEGFHAVKHALRFGAELIEAVTPDPEGPLGLAGRLAPDVSGRLEEILTRVPGEVFEALCPRPPSSGVVALARRVVVDPEDVLATSDGPEPVVYLQCPTHLGNLGAAVRVAAAAGAAGVLAASEHDPWHPRALRGSAGLHFAVPVAAVDALPSTERTVVALDPEGEPLDGATLPSAAVLAFGSERRGLDDELLARADRRIRIPMREGVSSLNLATAVAVVLYARALRPSSGR